MDDFPNPEQQPDENKISFLQFDESGVVIEESMIAAMAVDKVIDIAPELPEIVAELARANFRNANSTIEKILFAIFGENDEIRLGLEHFPALAVGFHRTAQEQENLLKLYKEDPEAFSAQEGVWGEERDEHAAFLKEELPRITMSRDELLAVMPPVLRASVIEQMFQ